MPGRVPPQRVAGRSVRARPLRERLHGPVGHLGRVRVAEEGRRHREGHDPAVLTRLRVDHAEFEMTARTYRREQRRHVVIEVLPDRRGAGPGPVAEGHALRHVPGALGRPDAHHRGVEDVSGPGGPGIAAQGRRVGAPGVHRGPQRLPCGAPARAPSPGHGGVGERGHQDRAELVREPPAPPVPQRTRLLVTGVHAHLHGRRRAHHGAALGPRTVETALHGVVPGLMEVAGRGFQGSWP